MAKRKQYWVICPKCDCPMDADFIGNGDNFRFKSKKQIKEEYKGSSFECDHCLELITIEKCQIKTDHELN